MEFNEDPSFIHEEGEDDYICIRTPLSQHVSKLADAFSDTDTLWDSKQRRQFNAKLRRVGPRNPEWMDSIDGKSLAQVSERLTHLARIRPYCPKVNSSEILESTDDGLKVYRSANEKPEVQHKVYPIDVAVNAFNVTAFRDLIGPLWNAEQKAAFSRSYAYFKEWLTDLLRGLEAFVLHRYRSAELVRLHETSAIVDDGLVREYLALRRTGSEKVETLPVLDRAVYMQSSYSPAIPPLKNKQVAQFQIAIQKRERSDELGVLKKRERPPRIRTTVVGECALGRERADTRGSIAGRKEQIPIGRPFTAATPLMAGAPIHLATPLHSETPLQPSSPSATNAVDNVNVDTDNDTHLPSQYEYGNDNDDYAPFIHPTSPSHNMVESPRQSPTHAPASPASIIFAAPTSPSDERALILDDDEDNYDDEDPIDVPSITGVDPPNSRDDVSTHGEGETPKKRRRGSVKKLAPGKRRRNVNDPDDDVSEIDDLDEVYAKSFSKAERSIRHKKRKVAENDDD